MLKEKIMLIRNTFLDLFDVLGIEVSGKSREGRRQEEYRFFAAKYREMGGAIDNTNRLPCFFCQDDPLRCNVYRLSIGEYPYPGEPEEVTAARCAYCKGMFATRAEIDPAVASLFKES